MLSKILLQHSPSQNMTDFDPSHLNPNPNLNPSLNPKPNPNPKIVPASTKYSANFKNQNFKMATKPKPKDLRRLMKEQQNKSKKKIDSPLARYPFMNTFSCLYI